MTRSVTFAALCAVALLVPAIAVAQAAPRNRTPQFREAPRPPGLGDNLPPGHGGPNPSLTRRNGGSASDQLDRVPRACLPGGALSGEAVHGQQGRARARARVCGD